MGFFAAGWKQPELFKATKPRYAKIKNGGIFSLNSNLQLRDYIMLFTELGYKASGFMIN